MFERNRVDNTLEQAAAGVEITLDDGRTLKGKLAIPMSRSLFEVLNSDSRFVDFEPYDGERQFIAKAALRSVRLLTTAKPQSLEARLVDLDGFDPWRILGLARGAGRDELRSAFHARAKAYHPDRYATAELPPEVSDYLAAQARRINAAYAALEQVDRPAQRASGGASSPVYTSAARRA